MGTRARTPDEFPLMKVRGSRRRAAYGMSTLVRAADAAVQAFQASMMSFVEAALAMRELGKRADRG